ncbi:hypothetical protein HPB50_005291 [Hyalomma asiaticum]|uniref:Uncharacterized protein n=1 Tax=Hyalomma asiaticum TaxID=266040 RepID=A0ACB7TEQ3_HYAAI|nr:hypothetical protein HPB50_005291 [Hyalomma asiaticum]
METYNRFRVQDHGAIKHERCSQPTHENQLSTSAVGISEHVEELPSQESSLHVQVLMDRLGKKCMLQKQLKQCVEGHVDLIAYFHELAEKELLRWNAKWREKLHQLKDV